MYIVYKHLWFALSAVDFDYQGGLNSFNSFNPQLSHPVLFQTQTQSCVYTKTTSCDKANIFTSLCEKRMKTKIAECWKCSNNSGGPLEDDLMTNTRSCSHSLSAVSPLSPDVVHSSKHTPATSKRPEDEGVWPRTQQLGTYSWPLYSPM